MSGRIAVIGAGVAGVACARALADAGWVVEVFDKGRRVGGRLAQRRRAGAVFDHGCQFVRPREPLLEALLGAGVAAGVVARWPLADRDGVAAFVGQPAMATPLEALLHGIGVMTACRITGLERENGSWWLVDAAAVRHGPFDRVALAMPPVQAGELLRAMQEPPEALLAATGAAALAPCWALLLTFDPPLDLDGFDARALDNRAGDGGPLAWIARNTTKPGRQGLDAWTVHATAEWSSAHLELPAEAIVERLTAAFREATGVVAIPAQAEAHRWRHAMVTRALGEAAVLDAASGLGLCGDWCLGGKVEAAFLSGRALAGLMTGGR